MQIFFFQTHTFIIDDKLRQEIKEWKQQKIRNAKHEKKNAETDTDETEEQ